MSFVTTQPELLGAAAGSLAGHRLCHDRRECRCGGTHHRGRSRGCRRGLGSDRCAVRRARRAVSGGERPSCGDSRDVCQHTEHSAPARTRPPRPPTRPRHCKAADGSAMDFGGLPPEINSARMYAGPGPARCWPQRRPGTAWRPNYVPLQSSYGTVISELTDGPGRVRRRRPWRSAATPYVAWLNTAAAEAEQTAAQARAAASAYQTAFTSMVPPEMIAANRCSWRCSTLPTSLGRTPPRSPPLRLSTAKCGPRTLPRCTATPATRRPRPG